MPQKKEMAVTTTNLNAAILQSTLYLHVQINTMQYMLTSGCNENSSRPANGPTIHRLRTCPRSSRRMWGPGGIRYVHTYSFLDQYLYRFYYTNCV